MTVLVKANGKARKGSSGTVLMKADGSSPSIEPIGKIRVVAGHYIQTFLVGEPLDGRKWVFQVRGGQTFEATEQVGLIDARIAPLGITRGPVRAWTRKRGLKPTRAVQFSSLTWPSGAGENPPELTGSIPDITGSVGAPSIVVSYANLFTNYSAIAVSLPNGVPLPDGWVNDSSAQTVTIPTGNSIDTELLFAATNESGVATLYSVPVSITTIPLAFALLPSFTGASPTVGTPWTFSSAAIATGGSGNYLIEYRINRNGARLVAFQTAIPSYTPVSTDLGTTISGAVKITDLLTGEVLSLPAPGSAVIENPAASAPTVVGSIADQRVTIGAALSLTAAGIFAGAGTLEYSGTVDGVAMPTAGFAINLTTGALTLPTSTAYAPRVIQVFATNAGGRSLPVEFDIEVTAGLAQVVQPSITANGTAIGSTAQVGGGQFGGGTAPYTFFWLFYKDGVAIGDFSGSKSLVTTAAGTYTAKVRVLDSSNPQQVITVDASGSVVIEPGVIDGPADATVSTTAQLATAMTAACQTSARYKIALASGAELTGSLGGNYTKPGLPCTITTSTNNPGKFRWISGNASFNPGTLSNFVLEGLTLYSTAKETYLNPDPVYRSIYSADGRFPNAAASMINIQRAINVVIRRCDIYGGHRAVAIHASNNLLVEWSDFRRIGMDFMSWFANGNTATNPTKIHENSTVQRCRFFEPDIDVSRSQSDSGDTPWGNRHADLFSMQGSHCRNIRILFNQFEGVNGYCQVMFLANRPVVENRNGNFAAWQHEGVTVRGNVGIGGHSNLWVVTGMRDFLGEDNHFYRRKLLTGETKWTDLSGDNASLADPSLYLNGPSSGNNIIRNNTYPQVKTANGGGVGQFAFSGNTVTGQANADAKTLLEVLALHPTPAGLAGAPVITPGVLQSASITPTSGVHSTIFTGSEVVSGNTIPLTRWWDRNGVRQSARDGLNTFPTVNQQEGRLRYSVEGNGIIKWAEAHIGRVQPDYIGAYTIGDVQETEGRNGAIRLPSGADLRDATKPPIAGDRLTVMQVQSAVNGAITWSGGLVQVGAQIAQLPQPTPGNYITALASVILTAADITRGTLSGTQTIPFHSGLMVYCHRNATSIAWDGNFNRTAGTLEDPITSIPLRMGGEQIETCEALVIVATSDYREFGSKVYVDPPANAGVSEYLRGPTWVSTRMQYGVSAFRRQLGGGTLGVKTIRSTGTPAGNAVNTTFTVRLLGPGAAVVTPPVLATIADATIPNSGSRTIDLGDITTGTGPYGYTIATSPLNSNAVTLVGDVLTLTRQGTTSTAHSVQVTVTPTGPGGNGASRTFVHSVAATTGGSTLYYAPSDAQWETWSAGTRGNKAGGTGEAIPGGIRVTMPGTVAGMGFQLAPADCPLPTPWKNRLWMQFDMFMPSNFNPGSGKIIGMSTDLGSLKAGEGAGDPGEFSCTPSFTAALSGNDYFYWMDQPNPAGGYGINTLSQPLSGNSKWVLPGGTLPQGGQWPRGTTMKIGLWLQLNTPGLFDGVSEAYVNNVRVHRVTGFRFITPTSPNQHIRQFRNRSFANHTHSVATFLEYTNVQFHTEPTAAYS